MIAKLFKVGFFDVITICISAFIVALIMGSLNWGAVIGLLVGNRLYNLVTDTSQQPAEGE